MRVVIANAEKGIGGAELWQIRFASFLQKAGDEVFFFLRKAMLSARAKKQGFNVLEFGMRFDLDPVSLYKMTKAFRRISPDVVLFNSQRDVRLAGLCAFWTGVPVRVHRQGWTHLKASFRDRWVYRWLITDIACVSREIVSIYKEKLAFAQDKIFYLPNGVDISGFKNLDSVKAKKMFGLDSSDTVVGILARLVSSKRQEDLIRAIKILKDKGYKLQLIIAGEGKDKNRIEALIKGLGLEKYVKLFGFIEKPWEFLSAMDIFAFPSEEEGLPNAVLEAMAAGKAIVATEIPGVKELIDHKKEGLLFKVGDITMLAEHIRSLVDSRKQREELGKNARARVERDFNESEFFSKFRNFLIEKRNERN